MDPPVITRLVDGVPIQFAITTLGWNHGGVQYRAPVQPVRGAGCYHLIILPNGREMIHYDRFDPRVDGVQHLLYDVAKIGK